MNIEWDEIRKRVESFAWRLLMAVLVFGSEWTLSNIGLLDLSPVATGIFALIMGEVSKFLNKKSV